MRGCALAKLWLRVSPFLQALKTLILLQLIYVPISADNCPPCPACPPPPALCVNESKLTCGECLYTINNIKKSLTIVTSARSFQLICQGNVSLDDPSLPALNELTTKITVVLNYCRVPNDSYVRVLTRLNVTTTDYLSITATAPGTLRDDHFEGLQNLKQLFVQSNYIIKTKFKAERRLLKPLQSLEKLHLYGVVIPPVALEDLPPTLTELKLNQCELKELPPWIIPALPQLKKLIIIDNALEVTPDIRNASKRLTSFTLEAPKVKKAILSSSIVEFTMNWVSSMRWEGDCDSLQQLIVRNKIVSSLPERWVANCTKLTKITLSLTNLTTVPDNALENAKSLQEFELTLSRKLTTLPAGLFRNTPGLLKLKLSNNNITTLPGVIFSFLKNVTEINLEDNSLGSESNYPLQTFDDLISLKVLILTRNPLGDLCANEGLVSSRVNSHLYKLKNLKVLRLSRTGAKRICTDWKEYMKHLEELDLSGNDIKQLGPMDFYWSRHESVKESIVDLEKNSIVAINLNAEDVESLRKGRKTEPQVTLYLSSALNCNCGLYWFAKAFSKGWLPVTFANDLKCIGRRNSLSTLDPRRMTCKIDEDCPKNCTCEFRAYDGTTAVSCQNRGLKSMPKLEKLKGILEVNITGNQLTSLDDIPENVKRLDIRLNNITEFSKIVDEKLTRTTGSLQVWLAGNPLACRCTDPLLRYLSVLNGSRILDVDEAKCADGNRLVDVARDDCWGLKAAVWGTVGAALALLLTGLLFIALKKAVRLRLKAYLLARGLCVRWVKPNDNDDCKYDAFLSFSHLDTDYAEELLRELESGPKRLKLCVHYRDWPPGIWIPAQIARSVAESRRTIILLSDNYMGSSWARAEFREAYAKAILGTSVRLIVVLLGDKPPKGLDNEMQHYVNNNTYVKWGEPAFWEKLRTALPEPRNVPKKPKHPQKSTKTVPENSLKPRKRRKSRKKRKTPSKTRTTLNRDVNTIPQIVVVPNSPNGPVIPSPPTPIVKFSQIDFPSPIKPPKQEAAACA